jgi:aryl-alcohol dehydrogenase-like predicted oxidoreductase
MTFGQEAWGTPASEAHRILDHYIARGGNFVDTANNYARGSSEQILGDYLGAQPNKRAGLVLATKFVSTLFPGDPNAGGAGRKAIHTQLEASLRRLRTDHIDLYWMHAWDRLTPIEETLRALDDVVRAGKVRFVGFSNVPAWQAARAHVLATLRDWTAPIALQVEYSLLERTAERDLVPAALELGLGITAWSPLKGGVLSGKYARTESQVPGRSFIAPVLADPTARRVVDVTAAIAVELETSPARVALAWARSQPGIASVILGARTLEQLDDNLGAEDLVLTATQRATLDEATRPSLGFPHEILAFIPRVAYGGATIDGIRYEPTAFARKNPGEPT